MRRSLQPGQTFRSKGTVLCVQTASGRFGPEGKKPSFKVAGTVEAVRRVEAVPGGGVRSVVEGRLEVQEVAEEGPPRARSVPFTLRFDEDLEGGAVHRSIRLDAGELTPRLEALQAAFTDRFVLPEAGVRVGEALEPTSVMFLDDALRRPLFFLFQARAMRGQSVGAPIEGRLVVKAREVVEGTDALVVSVALTHAYEGDTAEGPRDPADVRIDYRAAVEGVHDVAVEGGWSPFHDLSFRRRIRFAAHDLDYTVETEARAVLRTRRE